MRRAMAAAGVLLLVGAAWAAPRADRWIHLRVDERTGEGARVDIQVPVAMLASLMPALKARVDRGTLGCDGTDVSLAELRGYWTSVRHSKDGEYVTVRDAKSHVRIAKIGKWVHIDVDDKAGVESRVRIRVPVTVVDAALGGDQAIDLAAIGAALENAPDGELIRVQDGDDEVRVWIDGRPAPARENQP